jgi:type I restriction enzyme, S subunit
MVITAQETKLKPGYKQTEVGVIPEEWNVKPLKQLSPRQCVGVVVNPSSYFDDEGTVPFLVGSNVGENSIKWRTAKRISDASNQILGATRLAAGDLVTVRVGEPGVTAVIPPELDGCNCASMMIVRQHPSFDSHWLCWLMNSRIGRLQVDHVQYGTAQKQFNISDAVDFCYPVPPLPEQHAIATALSDVDDLIASLDRLIAKKRDIKQATMQQLLTGKTRLPGFSREWKVMKLEDVADKDVQWSITGGPFGSNLKTVDYVTDGVRIIQLQNIGDGVFHDDYKIYTSEEKADELISCNIYPGEIILSKMGDPVARACIVPNGDRRYLMASDSIRLVVNKKCFDKRFVHDYINSSYFRKKAMEASTGSTRQRIGLEDLRKLPFVVPPLSEQQAIANILSDIDAEIAALEQKRDKTRALKQGMMQELLTGKTRLI